MGLPEDQRPSTREIQETATWVRVSMYEALAFCLPEDEEGPKAEKRREMRAAKAETKRLAKAKEDLVEYHERMQKKDLEEEKAKEEEKCRREEEEKIKESKRQK